MTKQNQDRVAGSPRRQCFRRCVPGQERWARGEAGPTSSSPSREEMIGWFNTQRTCEELHCAERLLVFEAAHGWNCYARFLACASRIRPIHASTTRKNSTRLPNLKQ